MSRSGLLFGIMCVCAMARTVWATEPAGLLAEWNFDEGQGEVVSDSNSRGLNGKISGAQWAKHGDGFAISLDGFDDYIDLGESRGLGIGGPLTVEAWIRPMRKAHGEAMLLGEAYSTYALTYYNGNQAHWYIGSGGNNVRGKLTLHEWNHVVATFDGKQMNLWINGQLAGTRESKIKSYEPTGHFLLGIKDSPQSPNFKGMVDKVRVYDYAISQEKIMAHFQAEKGNYLDLTWHNRVKVTPYHYQAREEILVEADYEKMLPLKGTGQLEVTLSRKEKPEDIIEQQVLGQVSEIGMAEVNLSCRNLSDGNYLVRVRLTDDHGAYPVEEFTFSYPRKPRPLVSPTESVAPPLPPKREPGSFGFKLSKGGGFSLTIKELHYPFESRISWPNGDFNRLTATDTLHRKGEKTWKVSVQATGENRYEVEAEGDFYTIHREIEVFSTHVYVKDRYTNTTNQDLGILIYNETPVKLEQITRSWLSGYERRGRQAMLSYPHYSLSAFLTDANTGLGIIPIDDVYVV